MMLLLLLSSGGFSHAPRLPSNPHIRNPSFHPFAGSIVRSLSIDANLSLLYKRCREDVHANWDWDWDWKCAGAGAGAGLRYHHQRSWAGWTPVLSLFRGPGYKYKWSFGSSLSLSSVCVGLGSNTFVGDIYIHTHIPYIYIWYTHTRM